MVAASLPLQRGTSMIEVLVTVVILTFGLLGLAGMQSRMQQSEMEAYQRAQALVLLEDMANRLAVNRDAAAAASYVTSTPLGTDFDCSIDGASTRQARDACEWSDALQGAAETAGGNKIGAMVGARGCIESLPGGANQYMVTVAWQGRMPLTAPAAACGQNLYDSGDNCTGDRCRRTVTTIVRFGTLTGP